jgi:hypothetical protein
MKKLVVSGAAALALAAAAPAVAQAPTLTLAISRVGGGPQGTTTFVRFGELVRLSGDISTGANRPIQLLITPYRGTTQTVTVRSDTGGAYRYTHRPQIRTSYAARAGTAASPQEVYAHVRPKVGLRVVSARLRRFRVTMQALPEHVSHVVLFQRRVTRSRWRTVRRVRISSRNLSAVFTARLPRGVQRVRIVVPQTPGYLRGFSRFVRVTIS